MFIQVIQGATTDANALIAAGKQWEADLSAGANGWLGTTSGVTDDGEYFAVVRFESAQAAQRNSDRPEQGAWWAQTEKLFSGAVSFMDSDNVLVELSGDPADATFVQIMRGVSPEYARAIELMSRHPEMRAKHRPDVLGSVSGEHEGGNFTMVIYFTSEADARVGETKEAPPEMAEMMKEMEGLEVADMRYFDLRQPELSGP